MNTAINIFFTKLLVYGQNILVKWAAHVTNVLLRMDKAFLQAVVASSTFVAPTVCLGLVLVPGL